MTDYKNLKLIASSSPHIRSNEDTRSIMLDVIIALLPALAWSVYCFGWKALLLTAVSVVSCVFFEWAYRKLMKKSCMVGDLSAVVTGMLLSFVCPVDLPWWVIIIGAFFSIVVVKQLYGGIGCNFLNPALAGRAFLLASYATWMTSWAIPQIRPDVTSAATPMAIMKEGTEEAFTTLMSNYSIGDMFIGKVGGSLGEVSALCLLVGGIFCKLAEMGLWTGETDRQPRAQEEIPCIRQAEDVLRLTCEHPGVYVPADCIGEWVEPGQSLGQIIDALEGVVREDVKAPCAGLVFSQRSYSAVYPGTLIARLFRRK